MATSPPNLAQHLLTLDQPSFTRATQSPFLNLSGQGRLPKSHLSTWLTQDRLYAQNYIRFSGLLLANIPLPREVDSQKLEERIVDCLIGALANVKRELGFFESVARRFGLVLDVKNAEGQGERVGKLDLSGMDDGARGYARLFEDLGTGVESGEKSVLECWVLLWGMEKCYLEAWRHAKHIFERESGGLAASGEDDADGGALRKELVPNWTGEEFVAFVKEIQDLLQELWVRDGEAVGLRAVEAVWSRVLRVEEMFWPGV